ncbi:MAG: hypothetical protein ACI80V_001564 [Rhodothermales bacterium]|jgi:hypothetical protein
MKERLRAISEAARAWRDPEYPRRVKAVARTLSAGNRFTTQALAFAINQQMSLIGIVSLRRWLGNAPVETWKRVGVIEAGNIPFAGLQDYLAVSGLGHRFVGSVSARSPYLLPAFAADVEERGGESGEFLPHEKLIRTVDALIAAGTDQTMAELDASCEAAGIPESARLLRGNRYSVAVLDGTEHQDQRLRLAEDALLHEGLGCLNVALVFAPVAADGDPYFEAFSVFRGTFPAHPATSGALKMQQAFLAAVKAPHAYGDGLEYLVSRGEAEVQVPGHIRWVPYEDISEVHAWLAGHAGEIQVVSATPELRPQLPRTVASVTIGNTQRPSLDWRPDGQDTLAFLRGLGDEPGPGDERGLGA